MHPSSIPSARLATDTLVIVKTGPIGIANCGWKFYFLYVVFTVLSVPAVWYLYPETNGLTLEEIDTIFTPNSERTRSLTENAAEVHRLEDGHEVTDRVKTAPKAVSA